MTAFSIVFTTIAIYLCIALLVIGISIKIMAPRSNYITDLLRQAFVWMFERLLRLVGVQLIVRQEIHVRGVSHGGYCTYIGMVQTDEELTDTVLRNADEYREFWVTRKTSISSYMIGGIETHKISHNFHPEINF